MSSTRKRIADRTRDLLKKMGIRTIPKTMHGRIVRVPLEYGRFRSLLFDRHYMRSYGEDHVINFMLSRIKAADVVFDVGAYHGLHAILFAAVAGRVFAFEPNPRTFRILQDTVTANRAAKVIACATAVGRQAGTRDLWGSGSGASFHPNSNRQQRSRVSVVTLDAFAETETVLPDVMKIDVEGAEHDVLVGATRCLKNCRLLCVELHMAELESFNATPEMVCRLITTAGFKEILRSGSARLGAADPSRIHLIFEKRA